MSQASQYEDNDQQSRQPQEGGQTQGGRRSSPGLLLALLALIGLAILYSFFRLAGGSGTGSSFDPAPQALTIAREAYKERAKHAPTGHDFGGGTIVLQYDDGSSPGIYPSPIYEGYDSPGPDKNKTHSERRTWDEYILPTLQILKSRGAFARVSEIDIVIFTQFYPCRECRAEMSDWQTLARDTVGSANVYVTIWTLTKSLTPSLLIQNGEPSPSSGMKMTSSRFRSHSRKARRQNHAFVRRRSGIEVPWLAALLI